MSRQIDACQSDSNVQINIQQLLTDIYLINAITTISKGPQTGHIGI